MTILVAYCHQYLAVQHGILFWDHQRARKKEITQIIIVVMITLLYRSLLKFHREYTEDRFVTVLLRHYYKENGLFLDQTFQMLCYRRNFFVVVTCPPTFLYMRLHFST